MGNSFGSVAAPISTASYPAMLAIDESASMACARVIRGTSSIAEERNSPIRQFRAFPNGGQRLAKPDQYLARLQTKPDRLPRSGFAPGARACTITPAS